MPGVTLIPTPASRPRSPTAHVVSLRLDFNNTAVDVARQLRAKVGVRATSRAGPPTAG